MIFPPAFVACLKNLLLVQALVFARMQGLRLVLSRKWEIAQVKRGDKNCTWILRSSKQQVGRQFNAK